eukprot:46791-Pelagomonas_calceolata.AAC.2
MSLGFHVKVVTKKALRRNCPYSLLVQAKHSVQSCNLGQDLYRDVDMTRVCSDEGILQGSSLEMVRYLCDCTAEAVLAQLLGSRATGRWHLIVTFV